MSDPATVSRIAASFYRRLADHLGAEKLAEVRRMNATPDFQYEGDSHFALACASHEFCNANDAMGDAFAEIMGRECEPDDEQADHDLWNAAWREAKALYLTAAPSIIRCPDEPFRRPLQWESVSLYATEGEEAWLLDLRFIVEPLHGFFVASAFSGGQHMVTEPRLFTTAGEAKAACAAVFGNPA